MGKINSEIRRFIREHHVLTLSTLNEQLPYCSNLFYAYSAELEGFVFTSSLSTTHGENMVANANVAASIVVETKIIGKVRGLQISGESTRVDSSNLSEAKRAYLKKFPFAIFADLDLWLLKPNFMKLTDNRLGFGKKIVWREDEK